MIGGGRCPIVDTWWQTETGAIMMTPLPGAIPAKPGSCSLPFFGISAKVVREDGSEAGVNEGGLLVIDKPWPSMLRTVWGDDERFKKQYFERFPGKYFTGDGARRDEDGYFWVVGRIDDVVNVSGHRLGTAEIESALVSHQPSPRPRWSASRRAQGPGAGRVRDAQARSEAVGRSSRRRSSSTSATRSASSRDPSASASPTRCRRRAAARSCGACLRDLAAGKQTVGDMTTLEDISRAREAQSGRRRVSARRHVSPMGV